MFAITGASGFIGGHLEDLLRKRKISYRKIGRKNDSDFIIRDFNLETHIEDNLGYDGSSKVTINVTINSGVVIGSTSHTTPSFQSGTIGFATSGSKLNDQDP